MNFDDSYCEGVTFDWETKTKVHSKNHLDIDSSKNLCRYSKNILSKGLDHKQGYFLYTATRQKEAKALNVLLAQSLIKDFPELSSKHPNLYRLTRKGLDTLKIAEVKNG
jgi:hypothetical protein